MESSTNFVHPNPATFDSFQQQYFSLPFDTISFFTKNSKSSTGLEKLQKTCKYFFAKNKILLINNGVSYESNNLLCWKKFNIKQKLDFGEIKYWLNGSFSVYNKLATKITKNLYRCSIFSLHVNEQNLSYSEINFLMDGGRITSLFLSNVNTIDENGDLFQIYKYLEKAPNLKDLIYHNKTEIFSTEAFQKMNSLVFNSKFDSFTLSIYDLSPEADVSILCNFVKNNASIEKSSHFRFILHGNVLESRDKLNSLLNDALKNWNTKTKPNVLAF